MCYVIFNGYQCRHEYQTLTAKEDERKNQTLGNSQHNEKRRLSTPVVDV